MALRAAPESATATKDDQGGSSPGRRDNCNRPVGRWKKTAGGRGGALSLELVELELLGVVGAISFVGTAVVAGLGVRQPSEGGSVSS